MKLTTTMDPRERQILVAVCKEFLQRHKRGSNFRCRLENAIRKRCCKSDFIVKV